MNSYAEIFFSSLEGVFELHSDHLKDKESAQLVYMWFSTFNIRDFSYAQGNTSSSFHNMPKNSSAEIPKV